MGIYQEKALALRPLIEKAAQNGLGDEDALNATGLFPVFNANGKEYKQGDRFVYEGALYKVNQDHTSQDGWSPEDAPSLYSRVLSDPNGGIAEWSQPDSTNGFSVGDKVSHNEKIWLSMVDNNVWEPGGFGVGDNIWKDITDEQ